MPWIHSVHLILLLLLEDYFVQVASSARLPDIFWNASNPIFRIDNTDHIFDVNRGNNKFEYDQVNLICPQHPKGTKEEDSETYIIYNVSKEEYDSCTITSSSPRIIAVCDKPHQPMYFTITFRSFTPQPGGLEFKPGHDYYFITTSTGRPDGLNRRFGGRCASRHMKVTFKVCCKNSPDSQSSSEQLPTAISTNSTALKVNGDSLRSFTSTVNSVPAMQSTTMRPLVVKPDIRTLLIGRPTVPPVSDDPGTLKVYVPAPTPFSATTSTPHWWRPNYTKLPAVRQGQDQELPSGADRESNNGNSSQGKKGRAWLLVVAAGIAVGVACLIVCGLGIGRRLIIVDNPKRRTMVHHHHIQPGIYDVGQPI